MIKKYSFRRNRSLSSRRLMGIALIGFLALSLISTAVYIISGYIVNPAAAFFESVSAFTTTGVSVFTFPSALPAWLSIFRSACQWIGGIATLIFFTALIGDSEIWSKAEGSVIHTGARFLAAVKRLIAVYGSLTLLEAILLIICRLDVKDAVCTALSGISTGGMIPEGKISGAAEIIVLLFMILSMVNFTLYIHAICGHKDKLENNSELNALVGIILAGCVLVSLSLIISGTYDFGKSVEYGFFQAVSSLSTTGYKVVGTSNWPTFAKAVLTILSFIGGSSMSAASGIKIIRLVIIAKILSRSFTVRIHPKAIISAKANGKQVPRSAASAMSSYFLSYFAVYLLGVFIISFESPDLISCFEVSAALLNNVGTCASGTLQMMYLSPVMFILMSILMLAGRMELYAILIPFTRKD